MNKYKKQVDKSHYNEKYNYQGRYISYFNQQRILNNIIDQGFDKILEIGPGSNFLKKILGDRSDFKTVDLAEDLEPDYVGSATELTKVVKKKRFDIVCAFQVLEHLEYEDSTKMLKEMAKASNKYVVISIPQAYLYLSLWSKVSILKPGSLLFQIPVPRVHKFDGQHYWELGARGYSKSKFRKTIESAELTIVEEFTDALNPYHRFFVCEKS